MRLPFASTIGLRNRGFTLVELLITIAVLAILSSLAVPSFRQLIANQKVRSTASDAYSALMLARSEAMKRNAAVSLTAIDASDWAKGWKVTITGTDFLRQDALNNQLVIEGPESGAVGFLWTGRPDSDSTNARLRISSSVNNIQARCITLSLNGMPENKLC